MKLIRVDMLDTIEENISDSSSLLIHELLDRYEILYPKISELADLRRVVIDNDLSSIFRLCDQTDENEELRKSVIEENLHSIFRVLSDSKLNIPDLTDIRKTIVEKNLNSLFRLLEHQKDWHIDDLRRAMIEENLYSLFRLFPEDDEKINLYRTAIVNKNLRSIFKLIGNDDLRKLITEENTWKLWPIIEKYVSTQFTNAFKHFFINDITIDKDCFSRGQLLSKMWLVDELEKLDLDLGTVFLCAGWYATLATMLFESGIRINKIRSFDIDDNCRSISETFNKPWVKKDWKFKSCTQDIHDIDFNTHGYIVKRSDGSQCKLTDSPDTIINTSCEHIENFADWYCKIPDGKLVVLQSNNYFEIEEHVNCVNDIYEFKEMAPMTTLMYMGMKELPKYTRFMLIGYK